MVTFEIFARSAVELLGGQKDASLPLLWSKLSQDFRQKAGLTRFLPAVLSPDGAEVTPLPWQGSGDVPIAHARQRISGDRTRPRELVGRGLDSSAAEITARYDHQKEAQPLR